MKRCLPILLSIGMMLLATLACSVTVNTDSSPENNTGAPQSTSTKIPASPTQPLASTSTQPSAPTQTSAPSPAAPTVEAPQLTSIHFLDDSHGWGVTSQYILRTEDGGATWYNVTPAGVTDFGYGPISYFYDATHGWVAIPNPSDPMQAGQLYRTTDGGANWTESTFPTGDGGRFCFVDLTNGFYMADLGAGAGSNWVAIYATSDGGATWEQRFSHQPGTAEGVGDLPAGGIKSGMTFRDTAHGWVTGTVYTDNFLYLYDSADGGKTWNHQPGPVPTDFGTVFVTTSPPAFFGENGIMPAVLSSNVTNLVIYTSADGGATWTPAPAPVANAGRGEWVDFVSPTDGFAWATGRFAVTHDGAHSWDTVTPSVAFGDNFSSMDFVNTSTGWVLTMDANSHTSFYKTTDGGNNWTTLIP